MDLTEPSGNREDGVSRQARPDMDRNLPKRLNLGCGRKKKEGCLNVDLLEEVAPDLAWDLQRRPYPLPRGYFEHIYAHDVIEHLDDLPGFMEEIHALLVPGGIVEITTPHFSCSNSYTDPTHKRHLGFFSLDYFTATSPWSFYTPVRFEIVERLLVFPGSRIDRLIARFANRHPELYEKRFAWLFPAWFLIFQLRAVKPAKP